MLAFLSGAAGRAHVRVSAVLLLKKLELIVNELGGVAQMLCLLL